MYVHHRRLYGAIQAAVDILSFWPIWALATRIRIALDPLTKLKLTPVDAQGWVAPVGLILLLCVLVSARLRLYVVPPELNPWSVLTWSGENMAMLCAVTVLATFFSHQFGAGASRIWVLCLVPSTLLVFALTRYAALGVITMIQQRREAPRIALIGDQITAKHLIGRMEWQLRDAVRGLIVPEGTALNSAAHLLRVLGTTGQVAELVNRERIDRVIMINSAIPDAEVEHCNKVFWRMGLPVSCALDMGFEGKRPQLAWPHDGRFELSRQFGLQTIEVRSASFTRAQDFAKRMFDVIFCLLLLALLWPIFLLIGFLIKFSSEGPILEEAPRVGKGGRHFTCLKFRTTYEDLSGPVVATKQGLTDMAPDEDDQKATPLGRILRRFSLDELPQLINILRSEMSLVGPRPLPAHVLGPDGMSQEFSAWSETRARVQPGLTGLWQVSGRSSLSFDQMIQLDVEYVQKRSLSLDLMILLQTPLQTLRGVGAS